MPERDKNITRCAWCGTDPLYVKYHDTEWGRETPDDRTHFEFLVLESAQAGLSWITILRKRENYRKAYDGFDPEVVADYGDDDFERLMSDPGIVRNRLKIKASIRNAQLFNEIVNEFGSFREYLLGFFPDRKRIVNHWQSETEIPCENDTSIAISRDMKKRGFRFFGPLICYSHLQAVGLIDDHIEGCSFKPRI